MTADSFDYSPLATRVTKGTLDPASGIERTALGYLLHTTGGGVTDRAKREGKKPIDVAIEIYLKSQRGELHRYTWGGPAYVCDHDGTLYQIAPDNVKTAHCGGRTDKFPNGTRPHYIDGSWTKMLTPTTLQLWRERWPNVRHPYALFPSRDPNTDYVGLEMIPVGDGFGGTPRGSTRFTQAQHDTAIKLGIDLGIRHEWPEGWYRWQRTGEGFGCARLVGHEDVDILNRSIASGGWDPGYIRADPYFDFQYVQDGIAAG